jgi:DNA-binding MarR family transcriptional regulator
VSKAAHDDQQGESGPGPELTGRLGYLLKHAQSRLAELNAEALAPHGISGRELAVLLVLAGREPASQQEAAGRLGIDRTTMVAFLDALERKGLVARRPDANDRRRNVVVLTESGTDTLRLAVKASDDAQRRFLGPLTHAASEQLKRSLNKLIGTSDHPGRD